MDHEEGQVAGRLIGALLSKVGDIVGERLADETPHGCIVASGKRNPATGRRYVIVIATNDAANHLSEFVEEQQEMREAALREAGIEFHSLRGRV